MRSLWQITSTNLMGALGRQKVCLWVMGWNPSERGGRILVKMVAPRKVCNSYAAPTIRNNAPHVLVVDWDCWKVVLNGGLGYTHISRDAQPSHGHLQIHCMSTITSTNFSFGNWCCNKAGTSHSYVEAFVVI